MNNVPTPSSPDTSHQSSPNVYHPDTDSSWLELRGKITSLMEDLSRLRHRLRVRRQDLRDERSAVDGMEARFSNAIYNPLTQEIAPHRESLEGLHTELVRRKETLDKLLKDYDQSEHEFNEVETQLQGAEERLEDCAAKFVPPLQGAKISSSTTDHQLLAVSKSQLDEKQKLANHYPNVNLLAGLDDLEGTGMSSHLTSSKQV